MRDANLSKLESKMGRENWLGSNKERSISENDAAVNTKMDCNYPISQGNRVNSTASIFHSTVENFTDFYELC